MRKGEAALEALRAILAPIASEVEGGCVVRNPESELPAGPNDRWTLAIRDGDTGEPEASLSPPAYEYVHEAAVAIIVVKIGAHDADTLFSTLIESIVTRVEGDRTLGGAVDFAEPGALNTDEIEQDIMAGLKAAILPMKLYYVTSSPLG